MLKTLIVFYLVVIIQGDEGQWQTLKTRQGPVRGRLDPAGVYIYSNIPYALVPKGPRKFSDPLPAPAWLQPLEIPEKDILCPQKITKFIDTESKIIQEECLIANVYVPITEEKNLPVVVYIHGGAFEIGFGNMLSPKNFVKEQNVIVVTFNYRLGIHGFLCLGTEAIPGNAGLKDQIALLVWVQKNIASYGGNPENVTIAGYSAGSVSADLLMLAKQSKGLFNKVILESGTSLGSIAVQSNPLENAKNHAKNLNFNNVDDIFELEQFYKNAPLDSLLDITFFDSKNSSVVFGPCVERQSKSAILDDSPMNIIRKNQYRKVPILLGISNMEGLLKLPNYETWKNEMNERFSNFLPADLQFESEEQKEEIAKTIKEFYFGDQEISDATILLFIDYFSDVLFAYSTWKAAKMHTENGHNEIYLYEYSFVDNDTPAVPHTKVRGAGHCAQTISIFDGASFSGALDEDKISKDLKKMKASMRKLWYNFAMHRKPVPEEAFFPSWPTVGVDVSPHMSLANIIQLRESFLETRAMFWDGIYQKYYRQPIPPPKPPHIEL